MMRTTFGLLAIVIASGVLAWALQHHAELEFGAGIAPAWHPTPVKVIAHPGGQRA